jgi:hypothetical protein
MKQIIKNVETGEELIVDFTEEEIAEVQALISAAPKPIREIDARRLRLALLELGLLEQVETALSNLPKAAQIDWEYATTIREDYPLVVSLSEALGLDVTQIFDKAQSIGSV